MKKLIENDFDSPDIVNFQNIKTNLNDLAKVLKD